MNKKILLVVLVILCTILIAMNSVSAESTTKKTITIKNGMDNLLKGYSETSLNGKFQLNVNNNLRAFVSISNYKKLVSIKYYCYFLEKTTSYDAFGRPSYSTVKVNKEMRYVGYPSFESKKTSKGYNTNANFSYAMNGYMTNPGVIYSIELEFAKQPDLKISKSSKKGNNYYITIKNTGDETSKKSSLGAYVGKKLVSKANVPSLKPGKSKKVKVSVKNKYNKKQKTFKVDYNNKIDELYENNNSKKLK